jgi:transcription elongation GreA/GreB family factor
VAAYRVVGPDEAGYSPDYLSMDSPLGRAVMGKTVGDAVVVRTPEGERRRTIVSIRYATDKKGPGTRPG